MAKTTNNFPQNQTRTPRLGTNFIIVQRQNSNGQFRMTIPRGLGLSLRLRGGEVFEGFIERGDLVFRLKS
jgi:hypothetical protein